MRLKAILVMAPTPSERKWRIKHGRRRGSASGRRSFVRGSFRALVAVLALVAFSEAAGVTHGICEECVAALRDSGMSL